MIPLLPRPGKSFGTPPAARFTPEQQRTILRPPAPDGPRRPADVPSDTPKAKPRPCRFAEQAGFTNINVTSP